METYAVRLMPRGDLIERHLRRAEAERYVEIFNRLMRLDDVRAEMVREGSVIGERLPARRDKPAGGIARSGG